MAFTDSLNILSRETLLERGQERHAFLIIEHSITSWTVG